MWNRHNSWNEAETAWDQRARKLRNSFPLKGIRHWRTLPGIRPSTRKNLRWKALRYLLENDENKVMSYFWCKPLLHIGKMIRSYWSFRSYTRDNDFFLYGFSSAEAFTRRIEHADTFLIIGFSYCHKPFECPSGRFTDDCAHDDETQSAASVSSVNASMRCRRRDAGRFSSPPCTTSPKKSSKPSMHTRTRKWYS